MANIGFIGLGHMGGPMVQNLLKSGHEVHVYDVVVANIAALKEHGAIPASSAAELAANVEVLFTSVQTGEQMLAVCHGHEGVFAHAHRNLLFIDCSSIDVQTTQQLHAEAAEYDVAMLDAPVSGGVAGALAGTLTVMVGGTEATFTRALPYLQSIGKKIVHAGSAGMGQAAKICNNLLLAISMIGVSEAFTLANKLGLDAKKFFDISANASGQCWSMTSYCPVPNVIPNVPANHDYEPGFMAKMMLKDLRLAEHAAAHAQLHLPLAELATQLYSQFSAAGHGELDFSAIIRLLK